MIIPQDIIDELISQARQDAPNETCGYLLGNSTDEGDVRTTGWRTPTTRQNTSPSPRRTSLPPCATPVPKD